MDYWDSVFRSLDEPSSSDEEEIQLMIPKRERDAVILANSEGFCYLCEREVGIENLTVKRYHDTDTLKPLCADCKPWANLPHWLVEYAIVRKNRWRDRLIYEASERGKAKEQKKRWTAAATRKRKEVKKKTLASYQDTTAQA